MIPQSSLSGKGACCKTQSFRLIPWIVGLALGSLWGQPLVVSSKWLHSQLGDSNLVILDARESIHPPEERLPNAHSLRWRQITRSDGDPRTPGHGELLPWDSLAIVLGALGIHPGRQVVVVGDAHRGWGEEGYLVWALRGAGVRNSALLDGGYPWWRSRDLPLGKVPQPNTPKPTSWKIQPDSSWLVGTAQVAQASRVLDTRSWVEFRGARLHGAARGGRIPGAQHLHFTDLYQSDGRLRPAVELRALLMRHGFKPDDAIYSYCTAGVRSALVTVVLRHLGYAHARNYDSSIWGWSARSELPMERL